MKQFHLAIIGGGPAGMAAATTAAELGLSVVLLDEQQRPGGQIYRDVEKAASKRGALLGKDYLEGLNLVRAFRRCGIDYRPESVVWAIEKGFTISYSGNDGVRAVKAEMLLLATGALERPMPIPGWTLPGVMTAGAGQILLKQSGIVAKKAVLVGSGPLLYLAAAQMLRAGQPPVALVETQSASDLIHAARHLKGALYCWPYLLKGMGLLMELKRGRVPRFKNARLISIKGKNRAEALTFICKGRSHSLECETVYLHHGVVPNTQAARSLGVSHRYNKSQHCFAPVLDEWGSTDLAGVLIAGDSGGIGGAKAAETAGRLAAIRVACVQGFISDAQAQRLASPLFKYRRKDLAIRPFLDLAYPPFKEALAPEDDTIICRCEEVRARDIRHLTKLGCKNPDQTKAFSRAGMGPCQGRYCGLTLTELLAAANDTSQDETGYYNIRPPLKPVTLGELAQAEASQKP